MAKHSGKADSVLHVQTDLTGNTPLPVQGIADSTSQRAKIAVSDSGIEQFPRTIIADDTAGADGTQIGFCPLSLSAARTQSLDEWLMDTAVGHGSLAATDAGDHVKIVAKRGFVLKAAAANAGVVWIGDSATAGGTSNQVGFPLNAGESLTLEITRGSNIYLAPSAATQTVYWIAV